MSTFIYKGYQVSVTYRAISIHQKTFEFNISNNYSQEDFIVSSSNLEAYQAIKEPIKWPNKRLLIIGEESSGKSHIGKIWFEEQGAYAIKDGENIYDLDPAIPAIIYENIELINSEKFLFHLINFCNDHSVYLLMTSSNLPRFKLMDLQSRINATYKVLIKPPDENLLRVILLKQFSDRQLKVNEETIDYIFAHTERSYSFIKKFIDEIDKLSLTKKRKITIPLVKEVLSLS